MYALELNEICKSFGQVKAVAGINARIPVGHIYGFLGPNGAGKTTTLRMIVNILRPDSGKINLFGKEFSGWSKNQIGYMPEERGLYRKMTVHKILAYFAALKGVGLREIPQRVDDWIERIELTSWAGKKVEDLSRGMHQKLQFAVTVINNPQLLILDEPFSGLDPLNVDLMKNIILQMRQEGKTVIFSTHSMHDAETMCDSILLINKGKILYDGGINEIRLQHKTRTVIVELDGEGELPELPEMALGVEKGRDGLEIRLTEDGDPQELLAALAGKVRIRRFEIKRLSLHEIFVQLVGASNAENS